MGMNNSSPNQDEWVKINPHSSPFLIHLSHPDDDHKVWALLKVIPLSNSVHREIHVLGKKYIVISSIVRGGSFIDPL